MSMTQPLSGDNSVLGIRGIGVDGRYFSQFDQMKSPLSSKEIQQREFSDHIEQGISAG